MMPAATAARRVGTTPRRRASNTIAAPTRTTYCQGSVSARARLMAEPAMAPMAAGPAPSRKARAFALARSWSKRRAPSRTNAKDGPNATAEASSPPVSPARSAISGGVAGHVIPQGGGYVIPQVGPAWSGLPGGRGRCRVGAPGTLAGPVGRAVHEDLVAGCPLTSKIARTQRADLGGYV